MTSTSADLVVGPLLRYVDETSASVWVETRERARVTVTAGRRVLVGAARSPCTGTTTPWSSWTASSPGRGRRTRWTSTTERVWPPEGSSLPEPVIATLVPGKPLRMAFGSCRTSVVARRARQPHPRHRRAARLRAADGRAAAHDADGDRDLVEPRWPDLVLFLGDQVYADETTDEMREFISARRDIEQPPWTELQDYEEYAHLYSPGVDRRDQPLAALDAALGDDLRRPRHPRRLEHLAGLARRDGGHLVVARPHRRRAGVVLGLPAPRQPLARGAARRRDLAPGRRARGRRRARPDRGARRVRRPGRPGAADLPLELRARVRRPGPPRRGGLPRRAGARARRAGAAGPRRAGVARRADARRRGPPAHRHVPAVHARPRAAPPRGGRRGDGRRGVGPARRQRGGVGPPARRPRALGGLPGQLPPGRRRWRSRSRPAGAAAPR